MPDVVKFSITNLKAHVPDEVCITWQGKDFDVGWLHIDLDRTAGMLNTGVLNYATKRAQAEFHVLLTFPKFASMLDALEVDTELTRPLRAIIRSQGDILDNHGFVLSGPCDLMPHALLKAGETTASVLPGT
jgi:hypothetical protein